MAVKVALVDEGGTVHERVLDVNGRMNARLPSFDDPAFPLLRGIDEYGDTWFNKYQMNDFRAEWRRLRDASDDKGAREVMDRVDELAQRVQKGTHLFLKFIGD